MCSSQHEFSTLMTWWSPRNTRQKWRRNNTCTSRLVLLGAFRPRTAPLSMPKAWRRGRKWLFKNRQAEKNGKKVVRSTRCSVVDSISNRSRRGSGTAQKPSRSEVCVFLVENHCRSMHESRIAGGPRSAERSSDTTGHVLSTRHQAVGWRTEELGSALAFCTVGTVVQSIKSAESAWWALFLLRGALESSRRKVVWLCAYNCVLSRFCTFSTFKLLNCEPSQANQSWHMTWGYQTKERCFGVMFGDIDLRFVLDLATVMITSISRGSEQILVCPCICLCASVLGDADIVCITPPPTKNVQLGHCPIWTLFVLPPPPEIF